MKAYDGCAVTQHAVLVTGVNKSDGSSSVGHQSDGMDAIDRCGVRALSQVRTFELVARPC